MSKKLEDIKFGLLFFDNIDKKENFILRINETIKQQKDYKGNFIENEKNIFTKNNTVSWNKTKIVDISNNEISETKNIDISDNKISETKYYRIIFQYIEPNVYYFEKNGAMNCIDIVVKDFNLFNFEKKLWNNIFDKNKDHKENVINYINEYTKKEFNKDIQQLNIICNTNIVDNELFTYDYFNFFKLFNNIKEINQEFKLPSYNKNNCIDKNNKQSETIYNKLVSENNSNKYILLDRKIIDGCEVADLYDKENKLLFHNKKSGDSRVLSFQIIIGALIMKNREKNQEYIDYLKKKGINEIIDNNFKYVIGIIGKDKKIAQKDKISLGIVKHILTQHNIELYIDFINEI